MNQYDFIPPTPPELDRFKMIARAILTAILLCIMAIIVIVSSSGCREEMPHFQPEITGAWNSVTYPANHYLFHSDGFLEINSTAAGQTVWEKQFTYKHDRETKALEIRDRNGLYFQGFVDFTPDADTAYIDQPGGLKITLSRW